MATNKRILTVPERKEWAALCRATKLQHGVVLHKVTFERKRVGKRPDGSCEDTVLKHVLLNDGEVVLTHAQWKRLCRGTGFMA